MEHLMSQTPVPTAAQVGRRSFLGALGGATTPAPARRTKAPPGDRIAPTPVQAPNDDETRVPEYAASYTKGLPHDELGHVDPGAYGQLLGALESGDSADFEAITLGPGGRLLANPRAGLSSRRQGAAPQQFAQPPAPAFASAETAGEMVELAWMAVLRDVSFQGYAAHPLAAAAVNELDSLTDFRGPRQAGRVTTQTLFRDDLPGALIGPYVSQFIWLDAPFGAESVSRRIRTLMPHRDHGTQFADWRAIQDGFVPGSEQLDPVPRYVRNGRDLAQRVHVDVPFQAYFEACLILGTPLAAGGLECSLNPSNPYLGSKAQLGFGTWGAPFIKNLLCEVSTRALKAVWFQKWFVHRRLRPEEFGGRLHIHKTGLCRYPLHGDVLTSVAVRLLKLRNGTWLLPLAFPEGSPTHPSYGAGHAAVAGACVTLLKALFDERFLIPHPVVPNAAGTSLLPYSGPPLSVGAELNKLASNGATGRNMAGIHWRSDARESLLLGEQVAIELLKETLFLGPEDMGGGVSFTGFDGATVSVTP
jgi:hypothetical protein